MKLEDIARDIVAGLITADKQLLPDDVDFVLERLQAAIAADPVRSAVMRVFTDPRYREQWSEEEILWRLLAALDPWYPYKGARATSASS